MCTSKLRAVWCLSIVQLTNVSGNDSSTSLRILPTYLFTSSFLVLVVDLLANGPSLKLIFTLVSELLTVLADDLTFIQYVFNNLVFFFRL